MKIAYIHRTIIPSRQANSIHVMKMCQSFVKNGHKVILLVCDMPGAEKNVSDLHAFYGVNPSFEIKKLPWPKSFGKGFIFSFHAMQEAKRFGADIIYTRYAEAAYVAGFFGIPAIYENHNSMENVSKMGKWLFSRLIKSQNFRRLVVISDALKKYFLKNFSAINGNKILVAHDGADLPSGKVADVKSRAGVLKVGYIGHLYSGKGMEIIAQIIPRCPDFDFHMVGGRQEDINDWKNKLEGQKNITFHGFLPPGEVEAYRQSFDILLAPFQKENRVLGAQNISEYMSPLKIFEYMASRKPIIVSDLPVLREVLNEQNSIVVPPSDVDAWVNAIQRLKDSNLRSQLADKAYQDFITHYTWDKRAQNVIEGINL